MILTGNPANPRTILSLSVKPGTPPPPRSSSGISFCREPLQICLVPGPPLLLAGEERVGLVQDERVRAALPPGHMRDGQFGGVDPGVDVLPALLGERPFEGAPALVPQELAEGTAQVACATARRQLDRPVAGRPPRTCRPRGGGPASAGGGRPGARRGRPRRRPRRRVLSRAIAPARRTPAEPRPQQSRRPQLTVPPGDLGERVHVRVGQVLDAE